MEDNFRRKNKFDIEMIIGFNFFQKSWDTEAPKHIRVCLTDEETVLGPTFY